MRSALLTSAGAKAEIEESESADVIATFVDTSGTTLAKSSIVTLTATLQHIASDGSVTTINSRDDQNVLDTNGGSVSTAGVLTLKLQPLDNIVVAASNGDVESHYLLLQWTWVDDDGDTRTGRQEWEIFVRAVTVSAGTATTVGWLG